jgi:hypothetical protein
VSRRWRMIFLLRAKDAHFKVKRQQRGVMFYSDRSRGGEVVNLADVIVLFGTQLTTNERKKQAVFRTLGCLTRHSFNLFLLLATPNITRPWFICKYLGIHGFTTLRTQLDREVMNCELCVAASSRGTGSSIGDARSINGTVMD